MLGFSIQIQVIYVDWVLFEEDTIQSFKMKEMRTFEFFSMHLFFVLNLHKRVFQIEFPKLNIQNVHPHGGKVRRRFIALYTMPYVNIYRIIIVWIKCRLDLIEWHLNLNSWNFMCVRVRVCGHPYIYI